MPFVFYEYNRPLQRTLFEDIHGVSAGLNFRPTPAVVLKVMATAAFSRGEGPFGSLGTLDMISTQAAWVF
jgi:hypothetical protein